MYDQAWKSTVADLCAKPSQRTPLCFLCPVRCVLAYQACSLTLNGHYVMYSACACMKWLKRIHFVCEHYAAYKIRSHFKNTCTTGRQKYILTAPNGAILSITSNNRAQPTKIRKSGRPVLKERAETVKKNEYPWKPPPKKKSLKKHACWVFSVDHMNIIASKYNMSTREEGAKAFRDLLPCQYARNTTFLMNFQSAGAPKQNNRRRKVLFST